MGRPKKDAVVELGSRKRITAGDIERLQCEPGKQQSFLRDSEMPGLMVRVTSNGAKSYVFEARVHGKTERRRIGTPAAMTITEAREQARRLRMLVDAGESPRDHAAEVEAQRQKEAACQQPARIAWAAYLLERRPHWGERHRLDHERLSQAGGAPRKRSREAVTQPGILFDLLERPLSELTPQTVEAWARSQAYRPTVARLALRLLRAFLTWCKASPDYQAMMSDDTNPASTRKAREVLGKAKPKDDTLLREQLPEWFAAVRRITNPSISAYLQVLLLTGARPGEIIAMQWDDVNMGRRSLTIRDKVESTREIPLTPYVAALLAGLPKRGPFVFTSLNRPDIAISTPAKPLAIICRESGTDVTLHGLRRSFKTLAEWLDISAGVIAQLMGHKPSAIAEKHYTRRPLDRLREHHNRIEAWILEQAGIAFDTAQPVRLLRAV